MNQAERTIASEAVALICNYGQGAEADFGCDADEFSGAANCRSMDNALDKLAKKHGITRKDLDQLVHQTFYKVDKDGEICPKQY